MISEIITDRSPVLIMFILMDVHLNVKKIICFSLTGQDGRYLAGEIYCIYSTNTHKSAVNCTIKIINDSNKTKNYRCVSTSTEYLILKIITQ